MQKNRTYNMAVCAMIAAVYTALCLATAPISFGMVQVRTAEALTLLPVFSPVALWGVTLGCALSNLTGFMTGANPMFADIFIGTFATFLSAVLTRKVRHIRIGGLPVLAAVPPVLCNAVIIGAELSILTTGGLSMGAFLTNALYVGAGQAISCFGLGLALVAVLQKTGLAAQLFPETALQAS